MLPQLSALWARPFVKLYIKKEGGLSDKSK